MNYNQKLITNFYTKIFTVFTNQGFNQFLVIY